MADETRDKPENATAMPDVWAIDGDRNPYLDNVFALLGIHPDDRRDAINKKAVRMKTRVEASVGFQRLGRRVPPEMFSRASQLLSNPPEYVAERLLAHATHEVDTSGFEAPMAAIEAINFAPPSEAMPVPIRCLTFLAPALAVPVATPDLSQQIQPSASLNEVLQPEARDGQIIDL